MSLFHPNTESIALFIQTVQFSLFDYVFANYFGPCDLIGFYFDPTIKFDIETSMYSWLFSNGYSKNAPSKFFVNLIPFLLLLLLMGMKRNLTESKVQKTANDNLINRS